MQNDDDSLILNAKQKKIPKLTYALIPKLVQDNAN